MKNDLLVVFTKDIDKYNLKKQLNPEFRKAKNGVKL